jgi:glucose-6-phosphate 1-dehydrogenase
MPHTRGVAMRNSEQSKTDRIEAVKVPCVVTSGQASDAHANKACVDPCVIVIMGATGDLAARKLMPALFNLYETDKLPKPFSIVGCGRTVQDNLQFRNSMSDALQSSGTVNSKMLAGFVSQLHYRSVQYDDQASYDNLTMFLRELDHELGAEGNRIFYLALPPTLYLPVARRIGKAGLASEKTQDNGWARLVVEKPFGSDLASALVLDKGIHKHFDEHQVFRIDHYLAKETVQNVLMFRFANSIFEPVWNRRYIKSVRITAAESLGVEHRAGYYEQAGVLRDMFQNHMMQLLSLTAMEPPSAFEADRVRDEKIKVYRALRPFKTETLESHLVLGQYGKGVLGGQTMLPYREEPGVSGRSMTPTYARMKLYLDNWRWQGVPFYLISGKRLKEKRTDITIQFKRVPHSMFRKVIGDRIAANQLKLSSYPEERISLTFQTKTPGANVDLQPVTMDFHYHQKTDGVVHEAYEKVLLDCIIGDQMLFWRQDSVEACWAFLTPILSMCETCDDRPAKLHFYEAGTWGPKVVERA